jgi:AbiU2
MMEPEDLFANELEVFRTEAESAVQFFYSYLAVHAVAGEHNEVHRLLNAAPLFWNTILGALQTSTFIALGRVFDQQSKHNLDCLLRIGQSNLAIFSKEALAGRKRRLSADADEWLDGFLSDVYVPDADDFRRLRRHVARRRKIYEEKYRALRHQFFAHKEVSAREDVQALFGKANIRELQQLLVFLRRLHEALWQLLFNGRKPTLLPARYSVRRIREQPSAEHQGRALQERLTHEVEAFLRTAANQAQQPRQPDA